MNSEQQKEYRERTLEISKLLIKHGLFCTKLVNGAQIPYPEPGKWKALPKVSGGPHNFKDKGNVESYYGTVFRLGTQNDKYEDYFYPPAELNLVHDDLYPKEQGVWVSKQAKIMKVSRDVQESAIAPPTSSAELRSWDTRKISKFLLSEAESYEALYACIISQLEHAKTDQAALAISQIRKLLQAQPNVPIDNEYIKEREIDHKIYDTKRKEERVIHQEEEEEEEEEEGEEEGLTEDQIEQEYDELTNQLEKLKIEVKELSGLKKKTTSGKIARIETRLEELEELSEKFGFGRARLQSNRGRRTSKMKRTSRKKMSRKKMSRTKRTSKKNLAILNRNSRLKRMSRSNKKFKRVSRRTSGKKLQHKRNRRSLKKTIKRRTSLKTRNFGSEIYGLQGGNLSYPGVQPMHLEVPNELPNLDNVVRNYTVSGNAVSGNAVRSFGNSGYESDSSCTSDGSDGSYVSGRSFGSCGCTSDEE